MVDDNRRRGVIRVVIGFALVGLLAACENGGPSSPAPVVMKGASDAGWQGGPPQSSYSPPPMAYAAPRPTAPTPIPMRSSPPPLAEARHVVTVERGQSLGGIAARYHVSEHAIIEANHLRPPYKVEVGARLTIPGGEAPPIQTARSGMVPPPATIPLEGPPRQAAAREPDVVPLDGPPAASGSLTPPAAAAPPPPGERSVADEAKQEGASPRTAASSPPAESHGGRFPWPVRGNVVAGYGGAGKNDGINIAAPQGAPIRAIEGGEVAYAGNELKGYGNLVLVKHADGLISAYAHCSELLVRKGDRVGAGQVIAKVGTTGGVNQPQLHFELRRGQHPVDPREFLAPAPSAGGPAQAG